MSHVSIFGCKGSKVREAMALKVMKTERKKKNKGVPKKVPKAKVMGPLQSFRVKMSHLHPHLADMFHACSSRK